MKLFARSALPALMFSVLASCETLPGQSSVPPIQLESTALSEVVPIIDQKTETYGAENVLVVFDVDDTLLTMSQDLGGVGWYDWQDALSDTPGEQVGEIGDTIFDVQGVLFEASKMKPVEPDTKGLLDRLSEQGVATHGLTARGPDYFGATYRELRRNGLKLGIESPCHAYLCNSPGVISFETIQDALLEDFSGAELEEIGLKSNRPAIVGNGVLMVEGQHKGLMLHLLLKSYPQADFDAIVFLDDSKSNVEDLMAVADLFEEEVTIVHYSRLNTHNEEFAEDDQRIERAVETWTQIESALCRGVTSRVCE